MVRQGDAMIHYFGMPQPPLEERGLVVFDFDGTLADTKAKIVETATAVLTDFGLAPEELGDVGRLIGPPFPLAFSEVYGLSEQDAREVTRRYRERYAALGAAAWPAFPGIPELLGRLRTAGRLVAVASSKRQRVLERCIADEGLAGSFDLVRGKQADDATTKAETIGAVVSLLGRGPRDTVMVGDRSYDAKGALEAGVPCVGVTYGGTGDLAELAGAGATAVVDGVEELGRVLGA